MVELEGLRAQLEPLGDRFLGAYLFGSHGRSGTATPRSDIDICIVAGPGRDPAATLRAVWGGTQLGQPPYDVRVFEELPLYLKAQILEDGELILSRDEPGLSEYLRHWWKFWNDQAHRNRTTAEDVARIRKARG